MTERRDERKQKVWSQRKLAEGVEVEHMQDTWMFVCCRETFLMLIVDLGPLMFQHFSQQAGRIAEPFGTGTTIRC